jgi:hypothetical protein
VAPEPEGSSPHSQEPANDPYPEPGEYYATIICLNYYRTVYSTESVFLEEKQV